MSLSALAREISRAARAHRADCITFDKACSAVRKHLGLKRKNSGRKIPKLPSESEIKQFYDCIDKSENLGHSIMLRLLLLTGVRVAELCAIEVSDVNLDEGKIFINQGKGSKDRYVLFPESFRLLLRSHMAATPQNRYLFESSYKRQFSTRSVQRIVQRYARDAGIVTRMHPHLFRHLILTILTKGGMPDAQIQLISGHSSRKSLERYQHLALSDAQPSYEASMKKMGVL